MTRRWNAVFGVLSGVSARLPSLAVVAVATLTSSSAAQSKTLTAADVNKAIWVANASRHIRNEHSYQDIAFIATLRRAYEANPNLAATVGVQAVDRAEDDYAKRTSVTGHGLSDLPSGDLAGEIFAAAWPTITSRLPPGVGEAASASWDVFRSQFEASQLPTYELTRDEVLYQQYLNADTFANEELEAAYDLAKHNSNFEQVLNTKWAPRFSAQTSDDARRILHDNPDLATESEVAPFAEGIRPDGSIHVQLSDLRKRAKEEDERIEQLSEGELREFAKLEAADRARLAQQAVRDSIQREHDQHELQLDAARSGFYLLSTFASTISPDVGRGISVVGNAAIQVAQALDKYNRSIASLGDASEGMSSLVLTGDVLSAAMQVFTFLSGGQSADAQILAELHKVRADIDTLRIQMHDRFNIVDLELNTLEEGVNNRFDRVDWAIGRINDELSEIERTLLGEEQDLDRSIVGMHAVLDADSHKDLKKDINEYLRRRESGKSMDSTIYDHAESEFYSWATTIANDEGEAGIDNSKRDFNDERVRAELGADGYVTAASVNYLAELPARRFKLSALSSRRLTNLEDWAIASEAYATLALEWPGQAKRIGYGRVTDVRNAGLWLQDALFHIQFTDTLTFQPNYQLFDSLTANYRARFDTLAQRLTKYQREYLGKSDPDPLRATADTALDPWGDINQSSSYVPRLSSMAQCDHPERVVFTASTDSMRAPSFYRLAAQLRAGELSACVIVNWVQTDADPRQLNSHLRIPCQTLIGHAHIVVRHRFTIGSAAPVVVRAQVADEGGGEHKIGCNSWDGSNNHVSYDDEYGWVGGNWTAQRTLRDAFDKTFRDSTVAASQPDSALIRTVRGILRQEQRQLYRSIEGQLGTGGALALFAERVSGAKALLSAYAALGLPRSLETNDNLRASLYGSNAVLDGDAILAKYMQASAEGDRADTLNLTTFALDSLGRARANALAEEIRGILAGLGKHHRRETPRVLELSLDRLALLHGVDQQVSANHSNALWLASAAGVLLVIGFAGWHPILSAMHRQSRRRVMRRSHRT